MMSKTSAPAKGSTPIPIFAPVLRPEVAAVDVVLEFRCVEIESGDDVRVADQVTRSWLAREEA